MFAQYIVVMLFKINMLILSKVAISHIYKTVTCTHVGIQSYTKYHKHIIKSGLIHNNSIKPESDK